MTREQWRDALAPIFDELRRYLVLDDWRRFGHIDGYTGQQPEVETCQWVLDYGREECKHPLALDKAICCGNCGQNMPVLIYCAEHIVSWVKKHPMCLVCQCPYEIRKRH